MRNITLPYSFGERINIYLSLLTAITNSLMHR